MITTDNLTVSGAYGKDYKSAADAKIAFLSGKDFKMESVMHGVDAFGTYCSVRDFQAGLTVHIRYASNMRVTAVTVPMTSSKQPVMVDELERMMARVSQDTLVLCRFYQKEGKHLDRLIRLGDCSKTAYYTENCTSWQPFIAMHRAISVTAGNDSQVR